MAISAGMKVWRREELPFEMGAPNEIAFSSMNRTTSTGIVSFQILKNCELKEY